MNTETLFPAGCFASGGRGAVTVIDGTAMLVAELSAILGEPIAPNHGMHQSESNSAEPKLCARGLFDGPNILCRLRPFSSRQTEKNSESAVQLHDIFVI